MHNSTASPVVLDSDKASPLHVELVRSAIAHRYGFQVAGSWSTQLVRRLESRTKGTQRTCVGEYVRWLLGNEEEMVLFVESMLIGETHFLRTEPHFAALRETVVPAWQANHKPGQRLRIASLGCSTGEEPYSIAMVLSEHLSPMAMADVEITGLDVSGKSLAAARAGAYELHQLRDLSAAQRSRWFASRNGVWHVEDSLRAAVRFLQHNLIHPLPFAGLHAIFCRNVLIYFTPTQVRQCLQEFHSALRPGGYLILGHSETAFGFPELFEPVQVREGVIYQSKTSTP